ncbi:uncharacterized protein [Watersipora subatra]|uniref:uncharacterized protein n=1 Tax=Watersipora subatra TaxID=2589382 RepID=UPI00355C2985
MGFLPPHHVIGAFDSLKSSVAVREAAKHFPAMEMLLAYFHDTFIHGVIPISVWNVYFRDISTRTNNYVEAWNSHFNDVVGRKHPSIWLLISCLKDEEVLYKQRAAAAEKGKLIVRRRKKWQKLEERIQKLKRQLEQGKRTITSYWRAIKYAVNEII